MSQIILKRRHFWTVEFLNNWKIFFVIVNNNIQNNNIHCQVESIFCCSNWNTHILSDCEPTIDENDFKAYAQFNCCLFRWSELHSYQQWKLFNCLCSLLFICGISSVRISEYILFHFVIQFVLEDFLSRQIFPIPTKIVTWSVKLLKCLCYQKRKITNIWSILVNSIHPWVTTKIHTSLFSH